MKLAFFCFVLLIISSVVIYKQKQVEDDLRAALATSSARVEKLEQEIEQAKRQAGQQGPNGVNPQSQPNNAWMYQKRDNPLDAPNLGGGSGGSHKR